MTLSDEGPATAADELSVRNTIARVAQFADGLGSVDDYAELFTDDAVWLMPGHERRGRDDIRAGSAARRQAGQVGPGSASRHFVTSTVVSFPDADVAVASSYWMFFQETETSPRLDSVGHYLDTLHRTPSGWLVARREITIG
jgi:ketosteroid isomerase-like protein